MMPLRKTPSKVPAPPIDATPTPRVLRRRMSVTDQVSDGRGSLAQCPGEVARLLGYPRAVWVGGAAREV
jgi:hypothetical protein